VLDGQGKLPGGIDLADRSNIQIQGVEVRGYTDAGIRVKGGADIGVEECIITGCGRGAAALGAESLVLRNDLIRDYKQGGLSLANCNQAWVTGTILGGGEGPVYQCDEDSVKTLWSDYNDIPALTATVGRQSVQTLGDWQKSYHLDEHSISAEPEYGNVAAGDYSLPSDSALAGHGPLANIIGPYWRNKIDAPVAVKDLKVHSVTATTANLEWWTI
jgi:hypothetical protein